MRPRVLSGNPTTAHQRITCLARAFLEGDVEAMNKAIADARKRWIMQVVREETGLRICEPRAGGAGSSNTGMSIISNILKLALH